MNNELGFFTAMNIERCRLLTVGLNEPVPDQLVTESLNLSVARKVTASSFHEIPKIRYLSTFLSKYMRTTLMGRFERFTLLVIMFINQKCYKCQS